MKIYSIYNSNLGYYNRPIFYESDSEAKQYILNVLCADSDRALSSLRDVLELRYLGEIDFTTGKITSPQSLDDIFICNLSDIWKFVPTERIPRDSLKLKEADDLLLQKIEALGSELNQSISEVSDSLTLFKKDLYSRNPKIKKGSAI